MLSYVMVGCKSGDTEKTKGYLKGIVGVAEVHGIYGVNGPEIDYAFMVEARVAGSKELEGTVIRGIQRLPEVVMTRTFVALHDA